MNPVQYKLIIDGSICEPLSKIYFQFTDKEYMFVVDDVNADFVLASEPFDHEVVDFCRDILEEMRDDEISKYYRR